MTEMYLQSFVTFTRNEVRRTHLVFQKMRFQGFMSLTLRGVGPLEEEVTIFNSLGTTKIFRSLRPSVYINVVPLINFTEQSELYFYFKYWRSYKVLKSG